jgi:hypothetical protein
MESLEVGIQSKIFVLGPKICFSNYFSTISQPTDYVYQFDNCGTVPVSKSYIQPFPSYRMVIRRVVVQILLIFKDKMRLLGKICKFAGDDPHF